MDHGIDVYAIDIEIETRKNTPESFGTREIRIPLYAVASACMD